MQVDIEKHIVQCISCAQPEIHTVLQRDLQFLNIPSQLELLMLWVSTRCSCHAALKTVYILVCVNQSSRFVALAPLPNKSAATVAHALVSHMTCTYTTSSPSK